MSPWPSKHCSLSLHDALPICMMMAMVRLNVPSVFMYGGSIMPGRFRGHDVTIGDVYEWAGKHSINAASDEDLHELECVADRKSTRLNSSHVSIAYAVFCLKKI